MFWEILKTNFEGRLKADYPAPSYHVFPQEAVIWSLRQYRYTAYTSHNYRLSSLPVLEDHELVAISFTRDPVQKFFSSYFYCRGQPETNIEHPSKLLTLSEYVNHILGNPERKFDIEPIDMSQEAFLRGDRPPSSAEELFRQDFGPVYFFPSERFNDAMIVLERLYEDEFRDCSYAVRVNESIKDQSISTEDRELVTQLPWIESDRALHSASGVYLDRLLGKLFGDAKELSEARQNFERRCEDRRLADGQEDRLAFPQRLRRAIQILVAGR